MKIVFRNGIAIFLVFVMIFTLGVSTFTEDINGEPLDILNNDYKTTSEDAYGKDDDFTIVDESDIGSVDISEEDKTVTDDVYGEDVPTDPPTIEKLEYTIIYYYTTLDGEEIVGEMKGEVDSDNPEITAEDISDPEGLPEGYVIDEIKSTLPFEVGEEDNLIEVYYVPPKAEMLEYTIYYSYETFDEILIERKMEAKVSSITPIITVDNIPVPEDLPPGYVVDEELSNLPYLVTEDKNEIYVYFRQTFSMKLGFQTTQETLGPYQFEILDGARKTQRLEKVWDDNDDYLKLRPESVEVVVTGPDNFRQIITLDAANNWSYQWAGTLSPGIYTVDETVPQHFEERYEYGDSFLDFSNEVRITSGKVWEFEEIGYPNYFVVKTTGSSSVDFVVWTRTQLNEQEKEDFLIDFVNMRPGANFSDIKENNSYFIYGAGEFSGSLFGGGLTVTLKQDSVGGTVQFSRPSDWAQYVYGQWQTDATIEIINTAVPKFNVTIKKVVKGIMGDYNIGFNFTVSIGDKQENFNLQHDKEKVFEDLAPGTLIKLKENDVPDGYVVTVTSDDASISVPDNDGFYTITVGTKNISITVTNENSLEIDTGINFDTVPYILILSIITIGLGAGFVRKRRISRED